MRRGLSAPFSLYTIFMVLLLVLTACAETTHPASIQVAPHPTATKVPASTPVPTQAPSNQTDDPPPNLAALRHRLLGPDGWTWLTGLPNSRIVAFYGNPLSSVMGPLGQYGDKDLIAKLREQAQQYAILDPSHPIVPALDYVTPIAQPVAMGDGSWIYRMPTASIEQYINLANNNHALFFFDMQIGQSTIQKEVNLIWPYLQRPGVSLTLDPEFDMPPGGIPSQTFGRMTAAEINWAIDRLSMLVQQQQLPPKTLIIHQFLEQMLPDWQRIHSRPGVNIVTCVDGFGAPKAKMDDYRMFDKEQLIQYPGMKLFYALDKPVMSPQSVLAFDPSPLLVMYQ